MGMFGAPWICRRCINSYLKPGSRRLLRSSSTKSHASFSPALLARARNMATEHERLSAESSETFDAKIAKRIGELKGVAEALREWESARNTQDELQKLLNDPTTEAELREFAIEDLAVTGEELDTLSRKLFSKSTVQAHMESCAVRRVCIEYSACRLRRVRAGPIQVLWGFWCCPVCPRRAVRARRCGRRI